MSYANVQNICVSSSAYSAKYATDCFLKYKKWTLQEGGKISETAALVSIKKVVKEIIQNWDASVYQAIHNNCYWSPLHLAALLNDLGSIKILIEDKGIDVNIIYNTASVYPVTPLVCAAYAGALESIDYLIEQEAETLKNTESLMHWTVKGGNVECLKKFFQMNIPTQQNQLNLCSLIAKDALGDNVEVLETILGYDRLAAFKENKIGETTLFLAAKKGLVGVMKQLIRRGVPVNKRNKFRLSPLHAAIVNNFSDEAAFKCLEILLDNGARPDYEHVDRAPLHHAALRGFSKCVFELIKRDAVIPVETLAVLNEKIPNFIQKHLDSLISMRGQSSCYSKVLVCINIRFTSLINSSQRNLRETSFLNFLIQEGQHKFLHHPVVETYLTAKWIFVRKFFIASVISYIVMLTCFSYYVLDTYVSRKIVAVPKSESESQPLPLIWYFSLLTVLFRMSTNIVRFCTNVKVYSSNLANWIQWVILLCMIIVHIPFKNGELGRPPKWQCTTAGISIFGAWAFFLNYLRRLPTLGIYVEMLYRVITTILKLMLTFASLLIGFTISFMIFYEGRKPFETFPHSMLRVLNMMVGEMGFDTLFMTDSNSELAKDQLIPYSMAIHFLYTLFILIISIALINLLIGLAVRDIKGLRKRSKLNKTMTEIAFILDLEDFLYSKQVHRFLPKKISNYLNQCIQLPATYNTLLDPPSSGGKGISTQTTVAPSAFSKFKEVFKRSTHFGKLAGDMHMIHIYPNNTNDRRLPKFIQQEALQVALRNEMAEKEEMIDRQKLLENQLSQIQSQLDFLVKKKRGIF